MCYESLCQAPAGQSTTSPAAPPPKPHTPRHCQSSLRLLANSGVVDYTRLSESAHALRCLGGTDLKTIGRGKASSARLRPPWLRSYPQPKARLSQHLPISRRALRQNLSSIRLRKERAWTGSDARAPTEGGRPELVALGTELSTTSNSRHRSVGLVHFTHARPHMRAREEH